MASAISTGILATGSTITVSTGRGFLNSIQVFTDGTNNGTVTVYDNTAGSGTVIAQLPCVGASLTNSLVFEKAVRADIGLTIVVSGTGASGIVTHSAAS